MNIRILGYVGAAIVILGLGWYARSVVAERDSCKIEVTALDGQLEAAGEEIDLCNADKAIVENVAKNRIDKIRNLTQQLDADKLLRDPKNAKCVQIIR